MNNSNVIKILGGICPQKLADDSTNTELLHRSEISPAECNRCQKSSSGCFRPGMKLDESSGQSKAEHTPEADPVY